MKLKLALAAVLITAVQFFGNSQAITVNGTALTTPSGGGSPTSCTGDYKVKNVGVPTPTVGASCVTLTDGTAVNGEGDIWICNTLDLTDDFNLTFDASFGTNPNSGDGIAFVLNGNANAPLGGVGGNIGYATLTNTVAVEFDTWPDADAACDHAEINHDGQSNELSAPIPLKPCCGTVVDGGSYSICISWVVSSGTSGTLTATFDGNLVGSYTGDLATLLGTSAPNWGFTSGCGAGGGQIQTVCNVVMENQPTTTASCPTCTAPVVTATPNPATICSGDPLSISFSSTVGGTTYCWVATDNPNVSGESTTNQTTSSITDNLINTTGSNETITYTVYSASGSGCIGAPLTVTVDVVPTTLCCPSPPNLVVNALPAICAGSTIDLATAVDPSSDLTGNTLTYHSNSADANAGINAISSVVGTAGTYWIRLEDGTNANCYSVASVVVTVDPIPTITNSPATDEICSGGTAAFTLTADVVGTTFGWNATGSSGNVSGFSGSGSGNISETLTNSGTSIETVTYTVTPTGPAPSSCVGTPVNFVVTVNPIPTITNGTTTDLICSGSTANFTFTADVGGTTYSWNTTASSGNLGGYSANGTGNVSEVVTNSGTTSETVTYTVTPIGPGNPTCSGTPVDFVLTVEPVATAAISYPASPYCSSETSAPVTLTGTGAYTSGTYSAPAGVSINSSTGEIDPSASTPGTYTITYTVPAGSACPSFDVTTSITITELPTASISYAGTPFCSTVTSGPVTLTGTGTFTGGTFSSTAGLTINASTGEIDPSTSTAGNYTVTYTVPATGGCPSFDVTTTVDIIAAPTATISYAGTPFCTTVSSGPVTLNGTGAYTGGTYSSTAGLTINGTTGEIDPSTSTPGTYTVTYTIPASSGCPSANVTNTVDITAGPTASISYAGTPFCSSETSGTVTLTGTGAFTGGTYSSTAGLTINGTTGEIDPSTSTPGTYTVTYTVPASGGCPSFDVTTSIDINASPVITATPFDPTICNGTDGQIDVNLTSGPLSNGTVTWMGTSSGTTGAIDISVAGPPYDITGLGAGSYDVTFTDANGCVSNTVTGVVLNNPGAPTINAIADIETCGVDTILDVANITGTNLTNGQDYYFGSGGTGGSIGATVFNSTNTPVTIYAYDNNGTCGAEIQFTVTVYENPTASISYAGTPFCSTVTSGPATLTGTGAFAGGTYSAPAGVTINATTGEIDPSTSTAGTYTVTYTVPANGVCPPFDVTTSITITEEPTATISYAGTPFCESESSGLVTLNGTGAYTGGTFSSTAGLTINAATGEIDPSTSTPGNYTVTYTIPASAGCPTADVTTTIDINPSATASISYAGTPFCSTVTSGTVTLTGTGSFTGGTYSSTAGLTIDASTGEIDPSTSTAGIYTVTYSIPASGGCPTADVTTTVEITAAPTVSLDYADAPYCSFETSGLATLTGTNAYTGGTYSSTAGLTIDGTTGEIDPSTSTPGNYTVTYSTVANGGCPSVDATFSIDIIATPVIDPLGPIVSCGPYALPVITGTDLTPSAAYYDDTQANGGQQISGPISTSGTIYMFDGASGCSDEEAVVITINDLPTLTSITGGDTYCEGDAVNPILVAVTGTPDWTINYTIDGTPQSVTGTTSPISLGNAPGVYSLVDVTDANCPNTISGQETIVVNPLPSAPIAGEDGTFCSTFDLPDITASGGNGTFTWYEDDLLTVQLGTGNTYAPNNDLGTTLYYVTETENGCEGPASFVTITIESCEVIIPTAFTPNGDLAYDTWEIPNLDNSYPNNSVYVYNRWGNLIFQHNSDNGNNPYSQNQWDGTYQGQLLPVASYYFIIEYGDSEGTTENGSVSILYN